MNLNLPLQLEGSQSILIAGMGGGFDVYAGLPLYLELEQRGFDVHLANLSFSDLDDGEELTDTLVGVSADVEGVFDYFPEYYLAQWFLDELNDFVTIWCFAKTGGRKLIRNYQTLAEHLDIDTIILVDGGVDSLMRGDEPQPGTCFEDSLSLLAVDALRRVRHRFMACLAMGVEAEVGYAHLFENIAGLVKVGAFRGSCSLVRDMECYQRYERAVMYAFDQHPQHPSVICASVVSAVRGEYGDYHMVRRTHGNTLHISALMPIYWFFDAPAIAQRNQLLPHLRDTVTVDEAWKAMQDFRQRTPLRPTPPYPLP